MLWMTFRTQRSASGGAPLTRMRLGRPTGSASNDTDTIGFSDEGEKQAANFPMVPWMDMFRTSRVNPRGLPLSVPPPPTGPLVGFAAIAGSGSGSEGVAGGAARPKPGSRLSSIFLFGSHVSTGALGCGKGGGLPLPMPKKSQPETVRTRAKLNATCPATAPCGDLLCMLPLYRKAGISA